MLRLFQKIKFKFYIRIAMFYFQNFYGEREHDKVKRFHRAYNDREYLWHKKYKRKFIIVDGHNIYLWSNDKDDIIHYLRYIYIYYGRNSINDFLEVEGENGDKVLLNYKEIFNNDLVIYEDYRSEIREERFSQLMGDL